MLGRSILLPALKACSSKKGISALHVSREMKITHARVRVLGRIRRGLGQMELPMLFLSQWTFPLESGKVAS